MNSVEFKRFDIDQVGLLTTINFKLEKETKGDKHMSAIIVVIPEDNKAQTRKALKSIYPSILRQNYPEGIQWRVIEKITDRDFTITE